MLAQASLTQASLAQARMSCKVPVVPSYICDTCDMMWALPPPALHIPVIDPACPVCGDVRRYRTAAATKAEAKKAAAPEEAEAEKAADTQEAKGKT